MPQTPEWTAQREQLDTWRETLIPQFLSNCYDTLKAQGELGVVAFSCTFFQTLPALALGKRIKALSPQTKVVYGGASFHDEVGEELLRACDWMDAVCTGEAEGIIGPLFERLLAPKSPMNCAVFKCETSTVKLWVALRPVRPPMRRSPSPIARSMNSFTTRTVRFNARPRLAPRGQARSVSRVLVGRESALHVLRTERRRHVLSD